MLALAALLLTQISCSLLSGPAGPKGQPTAPAGSEQSLESPAGLNQPAEQLADGFDLLTPAQGLGGLNGYRQHLVVALAGDLDGTDLTETQETERQVMSSGQSMRMLGQKNSADPVYSYLAIQDGYRYSQEREGGSCRAAPATQAVPVELDPAASLPAVQDMQEAGREVRDGLAAVRYTFDERSLADPDGLINSASGEVWLAEDGEVVLSYILNVTLDGQGFRGSRSWQYELSQINEDIPVNLPPGCPPVPADLPTLPEAENMELMPGFARYNAPGDRLTAVEFYNSELSKMGWQALPGSSAETADLDGESTALAFARARNEGGQVLVLQLSEANGELRVIAQTILTSQPVQVDSGILSEGLPAAEGEIEPPAPETGDEPGFFTPENTGQGQLPADLPIYPGARNTGQIGYLASFETEDAPTEVGDFYQAELEKLGWTLDQNTAMPGMVMQMWSKDGTTLMITAMEEGGVTQITVTAMEG